MNQNPGLTYHNVDSYIDAEGFFCYEQLTRLDIKQDSWVESEQNLIDDLIILKSEYADIDNIEIFLSLLQYLESFIEEAQENQPYYQLKSGIDNTSINHYIVEMIQNIEDGLLVDNKDYKYIDDTTIMKIRDLINFFQESKYIKVNFQNLEKLCNLREQKQKRK